MTDPRFKAFRATIKQAGMRDGEWTLTLRVPQEDSAKAAHLALFTSIVFVVQVQPEAADSKEEKSL